MKNYKLIRFIQQSIKHFKLDLSGYNILLPASIKEPALFPVMASLAGAKNVYIAANDIETVNKTAFYQNELELPSNIVCIDKETPQILSGLDILIKGEGISDINSDFLSNLNKDCVISYMPQDLDFSNVKGIDINSCSEKEIPVAVVDPNDQELMLYRYFAHIAMKRCYEVDIDIFRSKILLIGCGELLENVLGLLKSSGAQVYAAYTDKPQDKTYIHKHLSDADAVVVVDYPSKNGVIIGSEGYIRVQDIVELNPDIKVIHLSGKIEVNPLAFSRISFTPDIITQNSLNVNIRELGLRAVVETTAAVMKAAESLIKSKNRTILPEDSIVSYNIINASGPMMLGRIMF